jgi:hypothetical protein
MKRLLCAALLFQGALLVPAPVLADDVPDFKLVLENHLFTPTEITIPADKKVRLLIENRDESPEEFDSHDLNREKVILGKSTAMVFIGPLKPGRYRFEGEFHSKTAQGVIIVQ